VRCPFKIQNEKWAGLQFARTDDLSLVLTRVRRFRKKMSSLQSEMKQNEIRFACVLHAHVKKKNSLLLALNFSLPTKAKLKERIFALFCFQNFFVTHCFASTLFVLLQSKTKWTFFRFCFSLISFSFRFRCENKRKKFASISLQSENDGIFRFCFVSCRFEVKTMAVFRFRFASFRFEAKMKAVFCFFRYVSLRSIFVSLQISTFRIDAK
jgi:hypothetical protein